jgi:putative endonuclease
MRRRGRAAGKASTRPLGLRGEALAEAFLRRRGLRILDRNPRCHLGEIDLVAEDRGVIVFVEVKARAGPAGDPPQTAVDGRKQDRLARLALVYLARRGLGERRCRFDVVAVTLERGDGCPRLEHFAGAFLGEAWPG